MRHRLNVASRINSQNLQEKEMKQKKHDVENESCQNVKYKP